MIRYLPATGIERAELAQLDVFRDLTDAELDWLRTNGELIVADADDLLVEHNDPALHMLVLLTGSVHWMFGITGQTVMTTETKPGTVGGALPYSRASTYRGRAMAVTPVRGLRVHRERFNEMLQQIPALGARLVAIMSDRVRRSTQIVDQREKMSALGKLAAGVAHELNNPAAALRRASEQLKDRMARLMKLGPQLMVLDVQPHHMQAAMALRERLTTRATAQSLSSVARGELEDELADWLEHAGVPEPWVAAEQMAESGLSTDELEAFAREVQPPLLAFALQWAEHAAAAHNLLSDISTATERISHLVGSIKSYSHMDRSPDMQPTDLVEGLENTLVIMSHKLKHKAIRVVREFDPALPPVPAYPGELNQVWTNLMDNAIDAMESGGTLTLRTRRDAHCACVEVQDSGTGIPPEIQSRIFEPFFTTKPMGEGTGQGLDIVHRIVTLQHRGDITLESEAGRTVFRVWIPLGAHTEA